MVITFQQLDFRVLASLFISMGPHKTRELAHYASVPLSLAEGWANGTARPDVHKERRISHYLVSKLSNGAQLALDQDPQSADYQALLLVVQNAESTWDRYIDSITDEDSDRLEERVTIASSKRADAIRKIREALRLPEA